MAENLPSPLSTVVAENEKKKKVFRAVFQLDQDLTTLGQGRVVNSGRGERRQAEAAIAAGEVETKGG